MLEEVAGFMLQISSCRLQVALISKSFIIIEPI